MLEWAMAHPWMTFFIILVSICCNRGNYYSYLWTIPLTLPNTGGGVKKYSVSREGGLPYQNQRSAICAEAAQQQAKKRKWDLHITLQEARRNEELIALSDSNTLRMIDAINGVKDVDKKAAGDSERDPLHQEIGNL